METNTRLIDGDIAPYLRKVAEWIEAASATPGAKIAYEALSRFDEVVPQFNAPLAKHEDGGAS